MGAAPEGSHSSTRDSNSTSIRLAPLFLNENWFNNKVSISGSNRYWARYWAWRGKEILSSWSFCFSWWKICCFSAKVLSENTSKSTGVPSYSTLRVRCEYTSFALHSLHSYVLVFWTSHIGYNPFNLNLDVQYAYPIMNVLYSVPYYSILYMRWERMSKPNLLFKNRFKQLSRAGEEGRAGESLGSCRSSCCFKIRSRKRVFHLQNKRWSQR